MNKFLKFLIVCFFLTSFLLPQKILAQDYSLPAGQAGMEKIFYLPKYNAVNGVASLEKNWQDIDILAPQYHTVTTDFKVVGGFGPKLTKLIEDHNLKVMPLIANANFNQKLMHKLLLSPADQDKIISYLIKGALTNGYVGWQYDFENINYQDKDLYTAFVKKSYEQFKKNNLIFSVVAVPRTSDYENTNAFKNWSGVYDYEKIAQYSDFVSLMVYDDPNSVGPVASLDFVNKMLSYVKDKIPAQKLSLGVPLYYWKWSSTSTKKVGSGLYKNILAIQSNYKYTTGFSEELGVSWINYFFGNKQYKIWFEDKKSLEAKLDIVKNNNLRGFSAWLLGGEDPTIWTLFAK